MHIRIGAVLSTVAFATTHTVTPPESSSQKPSVSQLGWLAGCLEMRSGDRVIEEQRMAARHGSMLGMGRTTGPKGLVEYELTLIQERAGQVVFEARPSRQPMAVFTAT